MPQYNRFNLPGSTLIFHEVFNAKRTDPQFSSLGISRMLLVKRTQMNFFMKTIHIP